MFVARPLVYFGRNSHSGANWPPLEATSLTLADTQQRISRRTNVEPELALNPKLEPPNKQVGPPKPGSTSGACNQKLASGLAAQERERDGWRARERQKSHDKKNGRVP